jgi:hypothetical protein
MGTDAPVKPRPSEEAHPEINLTQLVVPKRRAADPIPDQIYDQIATTMKRNGDKALGERPSGKNIFNPAVDQQFGRTSDSIAAITKFALKNMPDNNDKARDDRDLKVAEIDKKLRGNDQLKESSAAPILYLSRDGKQLTVETWVGLDDKNAGRILALHAGRDVAQMTDGDFKKIFDSASLRDFQDAQIRVVPDPHGGRSTYFWLAAKQEYGVSYKRPEVELSADPEIRKLAKAWEDTEAGVRKYENDERGAPSQKEVEASFTAINNDIVRLAAAAVAKGGRPGVLKLIEEINKGIEGANGPFVQVSADGKHIDISHYREFEAGDDPSRVRVIGSDLVTRIFDKQGFNLEASDAKAERPDGLGRTSATPGSPDLPSLTSIAAAFNGYTRLNGNDLSEWKADPNSPDQVYISSHLREAMETLRKLPAAIKTDGMASQDLNTVNEFLRNKGFGSIQLTPSGDSKTIYAAGMTTYKTIPFATFATMKQFDGNEYSSVKTPGVVLDGPAKAVQISDRDDVRIILFPVKGKMSAVEANEEAAKVLTQLREQERMGLTGTRQLVEFPRSVKETTGVTLTSLKNMTTRDGRISLDTVLFDKQVKLTYETYQFSDVFAASMTMKSLGAVQEPDRRPAYPVRGPVVAVLATKEFGLVNATYLGPENWSLVRKP